MRTPIAAFAVASLAACAGPATSGPARPVPSPAEFARPGTDPAARETPVLPGLLPVEQVQVRARRGVNGQFAILEFLTPGLSEEERVSLRLAFERGQLRLTREGADGEETWTTSLVPRR